LLKTAASENRNGNRNDSNPETNSVAAFATNALSAPIQVYEPLFVTAC
jgi:hypothetical protein